MKKKKVAVILSLGAAALLMIGGISVYAHQFSDSAESETVYKETTAGYGTLTVGITESGSVTIGSISQDMDEDISISSDSGSGQTSGTQALGTSTGNSSVALEVEEVYISVGQKMKLVPTQNMAAYLRKIAIDGYIIQTDHSDIKAMTAEIQKIGVNVNQIAKRVNATGSVYQEDIEEIKGVLAEIWRLQRLSLLKAR